MTQSPPIYFSGKNDSITEIPILKKKCKFCKKQFNKKYNTSRKEFAGQQYCSVKCKGRNQSLLQSKHQVYEDKICQFCSDPYNKKLRESKSHFFNRKFCSSSCMLNALHQSNKGKKMIRTTPPWNKGKKMSEEFKKTCRERQLNVKHTPESIEKLKITLKKIGMKGRKTPQGLRNISESMKRRRPSMKSAISSHEIIIQNALRQAGIKFRIQEPIQGQPDIFIEEYKICVFVDGDFFHANPKKYSPDFLIFNRWRASAQWARDSDVNLILRKEGYTVIRIWTSEIDENLSACLNQILAHMN